LYNHDLEKFLKGSSRHTTEVALVLPTQQTRVLFSAFPTLKNDFEVVELKDGVLIRASGKCKSLIVDRTHPVLVRAVLQKNFIS